MYQYLMQKVIFPGLKSTTNCLINLICCSGSEKGPLTPEQYHVLHSSQNILPMYTSVHISPPKLYQKPISWLPYFLFCVDTSSSITLAVYIALPTASFPPIILLPWLLTTIIIFNVLYTLMYVQCMCTDNMHILHHVVYTWNTYLDLRLIYSSIYLVNSMWIWCNTRLWPVIWWPNTVINSWIAG